MTLSKRANISQQKLSEILIEQDRLAYEGISQEHRYETLAKRVDISKEKLDELILVKKELRKKDRKQCVQEIIHYLAEDKPIKSMSEHIRLLIGLDMLDNESAAYLLTKMDEREMNSKLKQLKENIGMFENTRSMFRNKQGA